MLTNSIDYCTLCTTFIQWTVSCEMWFILDHDETLRPSCNAHRP